MDALSISVIALIFTVATFIFTQWRAAKVEVNTAARDTVAMLGAQVVSLNTQVKDLQERMRHCEDARRDLSDQNLILMRRILGLDQGREEDQSSERSDENVEWRFRQRRREDRPDGGGSGRHDSGQ